MRTKKNFNNFPVINTIYKRLRRLNKLNKGTPAKISPQKSKSRRPMIKSRVRTIKNKEALSKHYIETTRKRSSMHKKAAVELDNFLESAYEKRKKDRAKPRTYQNQTRKSGQVYPLRKFE